MQITIDTNEIQDTNALGEILRDAFFDQRGYAEVGCYTTFDLREDVEFLGYTTYDGEKCPVYQKQDIKMTFYWDGDGTLAFRFPDGSLLENSDCKKDHEWRWIE